MAVDTTQATSSNRAKLYVNGEQVTAFSSESYPAQNAETEINNSARNHMIGRNPNYRYFDGYLSDINFIDGQALDPTSFGEAKDGTWIPKSYSGSYGTNGFHLEFNGNSNDTSGNGNNWTANNISAHDYVSDSPTNNFATLNVLTKGTSNITLAEGNLKANAVSSGSGSNWGTVFSSHTLPSTGKYYVEGLAFINNGVGNSSHLGVLDTSSFQPSHNNITYAYTTGEGFDGVYISLFNNNARPVSDGVLGTAEGSLTGTTVVAMLAVDIDNGKVWAGYNGTWLNSGNPAAGTNQIATRTFSSNDTIAIGTAYNGSNDQGMFANFGQDSTFAGAISAGGNTDDNGIGDFKYSVPSGYLALCTANLPTPTIVDGSEHFNTVLYTGNADFNSVSGVGFQPDLTWVKERSEARDHILVDSVRTVSQALYSNLTSAEGSTSNFTDFLSDGFRVGYSGVDADKSNKLNQTYAAWNWKAGGTAVSNTDGSITSQVSANVDAGFSIVSYTGANSSGADTVGHGLNTSPDMIIVKSRNVSGNTWDAWVVGHSSLGWGDSSTLYLNQTSAASDGYLTTPWNNTAPTSSVFSVASNSGAGINYSGETYIAYCFANTEGYSKVGSYTGNGSADGPFVYTGFRPAWVMMKYSSTSSYWLILDGKRNVYNLTDKGLRPNESSDENTNLFFIDLLSNGFKARDGGGLNGNGNTAIYLAFAESPFKYANAR